MKQPFRLLLLIFLLSLSIGLNADDRLAYVINSVGETMSRINLTTGTVTNDIVTFGTDNTSYANQIIIRDTLAYTVVSGTDEIQIINLNTESTVDFINTGANSNPYWMAFYDSQYVYVSLLLDDRIAKIDLTDNSISYFSTGTAPSGVVIYDHKLFVVCSNYDFDNFIANQSDLYVYDIGPDTLLATVPLGINAQYAAVDASGNIHISVTGDYFSTFGEVYIIDGDNHSVLNSFAVGGSPGQITISPDNVAYLAAAGFSYAGFVFSYNSLTGEIFHDESNPIEVDLNCITVAGYQDSTLFTGSFTDFVNVIDSAGSVLDSYAVGAGPTHLDFNYLPGDVNGDFATDILDILYLIDYKFDNGPDIPYPRWRANVNADHNYNILDILYLIDYKYGSGGYPLIGPTWFNPLTE